MSKSIATISGAFLMAFSAAALLLGQEAAAPAKKEKQRASPHETASWVIAGKKVSITYGRPYKKGRQIFGGLEPYGKVWRTGADEATTLTTEGDMMIGSLHVVAGTYSLFTIPEQNKWTLVLNKTAKQWGAFKYDQAQDYGRTEMKLTKSPSVVEQLTIDIAKKGRDEGELKIMWDQTIASVSVMMH